MKKLKLAIIGILMITIILCTIFGKYNTVEGAKADSLGKTGDVRAIGIVKVLKWNNVFCVQKTRRLDSDNITFYRNTIVRIRGNEVYFIQQAADGNGNITNSNVKSGNGTAGEHNNIMGALLYRAYQTKEGYGNSSTEYSNAQLAIFQYWREWVNKSGFQNYNSYSEVASNPANWNNGSTEVGIEWLNQAIEDAKTKEYYVEFHYMRHVKCTQQSLIGVYVDEEPTPIIEPKKITVTKTWQDNNDEIGIRPSQIILDLYKDSETTPIKTATLYAKDFTGNIWQYEFTDLPADGNYRVVERTVPTGYESLTEEFNITNTLAKRDITVTKIWEDDDNRDGKRQNSVQVTLYKNGQKTTQTAILTTSNDWKATFTNLPKYYKNEKGEIVECKYTVRETTTIDGYESKEANNSNGYTITNIHIPEKVKVTVTKIWDDENNIDGLRTPIQITLKGTVKGSEVCIKGKEKTVTATLTEENDWTYTFEDLYKYERTGQQIVYSVVEAPIEDYEQEVHEGQLDKDGNVTIKITNTHTPHYDGYIEISGKVWVDMPDSKGNDLNGVLDTSEDSKDERLKNVKVRLCDKNGNPIKSTYTDENGEFTRNDYAKTDENGEYTIRVNYDNSYNVYKLYESAETIQNTLKTAYVEFEYDGMLYTTVRTSNTGDNTSKAKENESERFDINKGDVITQGYPSITRETPTPDKWSNTSITASTQDIISFATYSDKEAKQSSEIMKYCYGNGKYERTRYNDSTQVDTNKIHDCIDCEKKGHTKDEWKYAVDVIEILNINLGLFEREQPDVAIFSDLTKVEVEMNSQKYTYLYGIRNTNPDTPEKLKVKFQNKNTYTYRRPVNPADIAYIQEPANSNKMSVKVTYEIKVGNLSTTLKTKVDKIANYFDKNYILNTDGWTETTSGGEFKKVTKDNLGIELEPLKQSEPIELSYTVNVEAIKGLLSQEATLNNAVEIEKYSTYYGDDTLYAEERTGGVRVGKPYAGYDYNSHPGDANIKLKTGEDGVERLYSTDKSGNIISIDKLQDDTDIAPSFVLCLDAPTTATGIVWEDANVMSAESKERLGDGKRDDEENKVENVKIELYEVDNAGNIGAQPTTLYTIDSTGNINTHLASTYSNENGNYAFEGLVTGKEYLIKYTYGNELTGKETTINVKNSTIKNEVNARNYKSTIITDDDPNVKNILEKDYSSISNEEKMWPLTHNERYSVAVDNLEDRLSIGVLKNSTYGNGENMTAYTKPFIIPLEFDFTLGTTGNSDKDGNVKDLNEVTISNVLNKFDFGIIERPREELIVQKTISYFKITLANGQLLIEGNPNDPDANINYTKAIGFRDSTSVEEARMALEKRLLVEIDSELIQGVQLEVTYAVKIINNNEIDYDYGELADYTNGYIAKGDKASYYYYGDRTKFNNDDILQSTIKFVDYLDAKLAYKEDTIQWKQGNTVDLNANGFINEAVSDELKKGKYIILQNKTEDPGGSSITIPRGITTTPIYMVTSKILANGDDNTFYNHAEIIEIDGKTGRTIKGKYEDGSQIEYTPGNYIPGVTSHEDSESDDDKVNITITPPTGITNYMTTYVISGLVGLIIILVAGIFIKKKVLNN